MVFLWLCGMKVCSISFVELVVASLALLGGVSISCCGCELCLIGVVFVVALRVGVIFLLKLASPALCSRLRERTT